MPSERPRTLSIDVGGTGLKAMILDARGAPLTDRARVLTPQPAMPKVLLAAITKLVAPLGDYDRVSVGFPGVVIGGVTKTAPNLHPTWKGFPLARTLAKRLGRPTRVLNDAGVQGFGVIEGKDLELVLTLGTGLGSALFYEGVYIPTLDSIPESLHTVHRARELTEQALDSGEYKLPKNADKLATFKELDEQFHGELEKLGTIAKSKDGAAIGSQLGAVLSTCSGCHAQFRP